MLNSRKYKKSKAKMKGNNGNHNKSYPKQKGPNITQSTSQMNQLQYPSRSYDQHRKTIFQFSICKENDILPGVRNTKSNEISSSDDHTGNGFQTTISKLSSDGSLTDVADSMPLHDNQLPCLDNKTRGSSTYGDESVKQEATRKQRVKKENKKNVITNNNHSNQDRTHIYEKTLQKNMHIIPTSHQLAKSNDEISSIISLPNAHSFTKILNEDRKTNSYHQSDMMITINPYNVDRNIQSASNDRSKAKNIKKSNQSHPKKIRQHPRRQTHPMGKGEQFHSKSIPITSIGKMDVLSGAFSAFNTLKLDMGDMQDIISDAITHHKIFICMGNFPTLRNSLRCRQWIEKNYKTRQTNANIAQVMVYHRENAVDEGQCNSSDQQDDLASKSSSSDDSLKEVIKADAKALLIRAKHSSPSLDSILDRQCRLMARAVQNLQPGLIWTSKRDDIDFKSLAKYQIANHYEKLIPLTTKVGLCESVKNLKWIQEIDPNTFFPRCFQLNMEDEMQAFIDEYRLTAAINILKWVVDPAINGTASIPTVKHSEQLHDAIVRYALQACQEFLEQEKHLDIDRASDGESKLTENKWNLVLSSYYQIIHYGIDFKNRPMFEEEAMDMLEKVKLIRPQFDIDGVRNVWIMKPAAKSRGRGIVCMDRLSDITECYQQCRDSRWVIQKYIERPMLIYNTKFDIRQWFLVTDWNPLTVWIYKDSYLRFCTQQYTLNNLEEKIHLSNNAIQKKYSNGERSKYLPTENMWNSNKFKQYLKQNDHHDAWEKVIYPGMKNIISLILQANQDSNIDYRKNSFELFGADFMLGDDFKPWLIEINSCPDLSASTSVTAELCASVINDTIKVVIDRRYNRSCDIGEFELLIKKQSIEIPAYVGLNLAIQGKTIPKLATDRASPKYDNKLEQLLNWPQNQEQSSVYGQRQGGITLRNPYQQNSRKSLKKLLTMANIRMQTTAYKSALIQSQEARSYAPLDSSNTAITSTKNTNNPIYGSKTIPFCTKPIHYTALLQNILQSRGTIKS